MPALAPYLDAAVLQPHLTQAEAQAQMELAIAYNCRTICVRPSDIDLALALCQGKTTQVSCVLAFPHGTSSAQAKLQEAADSARPGLLEIDMVMNYGLLRSGAHQRVQDEIQAIATLCHSQNIGLKVILETALLTPAEIRDGTLLCIQAGADFVKTSTGFASGGATEESVALLLATANGRIAVKASGGIRTRDQAWHYIQMGCQRLGVGAGAVEALCVGDDKG